MEYVFTVLSSWLVPGSGFWLLGYRTRGVLLGGSILLLFWVGQALAIPPTPPPHAKPEELGLSRKPLAVARQVSPIFFACQAGNGFSALFSNALWGEPRYSEKTHGEPDRYLPRNLNLAILFTSVSGLLNYLLVLHIMDPRSWEEAARDRAQAEAMDRRGDAEEAAS